MSKFYKEYLSWSDLKNDQKFLKISDCIELINESEFKDELIRLFNTEEIGDETVPIQGLSKVVKSIISRDKQYEKIDIVSHISNISCIKNDDRNITLKFKDVESLGVETLHAEAIYSTKKEYLEGGYKLDKFANFCIANDCFELVTNNIESLNEKFKDSDSHIKSYRLLKDGDGKFYVRAITSVNSYHDYNIRFSLFVTIIALSQLIKKNNESFQITRCEYSESFIKLFIKKQTSTKLKGIGELSFVLEMSNDEIKREAFKFGGLFKLSLKDKGEQRNVYLKPKKIKTKLISIKHNFKPQTVIASLSGLASFIKEAESEMIEDIKDLHKVSNPDLLRFALLRKIERSSNSDLGVYKDTIRKELNKKIYKIGELLILMDKVDDVVKDLDVKEYLRYLFYDILMTKK